MGYAAVLALCFPLFFLGASGLGPAALGGGTFATFWVSSSLVIFTLLFAVGPAAAPTAAAAAASGAPPPPPSSPHLPLAVTPAAAESAARLAARRPRRAPLLALLAFLQCIVWLNAAADELVALFEAVGGIWSVRRDVLGATVLTWGETVPDLVAVVSLARSGQGTMAIAACFGGPVFNLLVSMGGPIMYAAAKNGAVEYRVTSGVLVLVGATLCALGYLLAAVPLRHGWALRRRVGLTLLGFYAASQVAFLLVEGVVVS
jgi:sodium/potassium/calcium exchanger 6